MQVNIGINNEVSLYGGRDFTETTPYQPTFITTKTKKGDNGMAHFGDIAKAFDEHTREMVKEKKVKNQNGLYLRTLMLFMAYVNIPVKERTPSNATSYLINKLNFPASSAMISRNNHALVDYGLIKLVEDPTDARAKTVELTPVGEKFAKLMR